MIGIFDSGLGGLSVLRELQRQMPACDVLYFGDTARGAIDQQSPERVAGVVADGLARLAEMGARLLVVADHAAAACLRADIRSRFAIPLLDIVAHGVVPGVRDLSGGAIGIVGPPVVESAGAHRAAIGDAVPNARIFSISAPLLSPLVDAGWLKKPETVMIVKKYLHYFKLRQIDTLVLGSNHYLLLSAVIQRKIGRRVSLVNGAPLLARGVKAFLEEHPDAGIRGLGGGACRVVVSDLTDAMAKSARMFYGKNILLERI